LINEYKWQGEEYGGVVKKCRRLVSGKPCFLIAYDDEERSPEEVCLPDLVNLRSVVIRAGYQSACSTPCSTPRPISAFSVYGEVS
jgi:hypothetical protein